MLELSENMTKRILVTGLTGFTGKFIKPLCISYGFEIYGLRSDLRNLIDLSNEINQLKPFYVIHLASISSITNNNQNDYYEVNLIGTQNLLIALNNLLNKPEKILLISSGNVYGLNYKIKYFSEDDNPMPSNHYALSKLGMEFIAHSFMNSLSIVIARPFNYTGVGQDNNFVIPKIINHFKLKKREIELGNILIEREFNDVRLISDIYLKLLIFGIPGEIYNVCSGKLFSIKKIISILSEITNHSLIIKNDPLLIRNDDMKSLGGSNKKLLNLLDNISYPSIEDTLIWMLGGK